MPGNRGLCHGDTSQPSSCDTSEPAHLKVMGKGLRACQSANLGGVSLDRPLEMVLESFFPSHCLGWITSLGTGSHHPCTPLELCCPQECHTPLGWSC